MACGKGQVAVRDYWRTSPRKKRKAPATYWTCRKGATSHTCGVRHATRGAAYTHSTRLDRIERRKGRTPNWEPMKVSR